MSQQLPNPDAFDDLERSVIEAVSLDEAWSLLEEFSGLYRLSGTEDEEQAAEYITDRLDANGVSYNRYDPKLYISQPHDATLAVRDRPFETGPIKTVAFSASTTVSGPVKFVGSPGEDLLEASSGPGEPFQDVGDLSGTIALTEAGSLSIRAAGILEERGADGVIAVHEHDREPHDGIATPVWGGAPPFEQKEEIPSIPIVNVTRLDGETLIDWAKSDRGLEVKLETDLTTDWFECPVVIANVEGQASNSDDFVLLHGHYDSWYTGITDNATGDAGLLELARVFEEHAEELKRNLRVAWWPAHSTGRYAGSTWYADEFAHDLVDNCVAHVNMDSPGAADTTEYTDMSCWTPEAHPLVASAIDDVTGAPYEEHHPYRAGDYSFDNLGLTGFFMLSSNIPEEIRDERGYHPVGGGGCGGNSDAWHVSTDTLDKAGRDELRRDIHLYAVSILRVLDADVLPFDHRRNVAALLDAVEEYDTVAGDGFDFEPTIQELQSLQTELDTFYEAVERDDIRHEDANEVITALSRKLTRLNLTSEGQFQQDPALSHEPFPSLAVAQKFQILEDDDRRFLAVQLKREQNRVVHEVREARALL